MASMRERGTRQHAATHRSWLLACLWQERLLGGPGSPP